MTRHRRASGPSHSRVTSHNIASSSITSWPLAKEPGSIGHRYDAHDQRCTGHSHDRGDAGRVSQRAGLLRRRRIDRKRSGRLQYVPPRLQPVDQSRSIGVPACNRLARVTTARCRRRITSGVRDLSTDRFQVQTSNPGGVLRVNHVSSSEEKGLAWPLVWAAKAPPVWAGCVATPTKASLR